MRLGWLEAAVALTATIASAKVGYYELPSLSSSLIVID